MYTSLSQATVVFAETEVYFHCTYTLHIAVGKVTLHKSSKSEKFCIQRNYFSNNTIGIEDRGVISEVLRRHGCGGVHQAEVGVLHQVDLQQGGEQCSHKTNMGRNSQVHCKVKSF